MERELAADLAGWLEDHADAVIAHETLAEIASNASQYRPRPYGKSWTLASGRCAWRPRGSASTEFAAKRWSARLRRPEAAGRGPALRDARLAQLRTRPAAATVR